NQDHSDKIAQEHAAGNPLGRELLQRNAGHVCRVQQMLHPIKDRRNAHEESWKGRRCRRRSRGRRSRTGTPRRHRESERAAAEGELSQRQGPKESVVWVCSSLKSVMTPTRRSSDALT